jgi:hypothetical protein
MAHAIARCHGINPADTGNRSRSALTTTLTQAPVTQRGRTFCRIAKIRANSSGDYTDTAAETNWIENAEFMKFSNFHSVFCTDDSHMGHQYVCSDVSEESAASVFKVTEY